MRESEYWANIELARGIQRRYAQVYKPARRESQALAVTLAIACGAVIGILLALGV
jgi:hypothetical protein